MGDHVEFHGEPWQPDYQHSPVQGISNRWRVRSGDFDENAHAILIALDVMDAEYFDELVKKYRTKGIFVDTNLMLLLLVGLYNPARIATFKRTQQFTVNDYALLLGILGLFDRKVTTPNVITEVDNLSRQMPSNEHKIVAAKMLELCGGLFEVYWPSRDAMTHFQYANVGLTDVGMILGAGDCLVLTDDFALAGRLQYLKYDVLNLNHLRQF